MTFSEFLAMSTEDQQALVFKLRDELLATPLVWVDSAGQVHGAGQQVASS